MAEYIFLCAMYVYVFLCISIERRKERMKKMVEKSRDSLVFSSVLIFMGFYVFSHVILDITRNKEDLNDQYKRHILSR